MLGKAVCYQPTGVKISKGKPWAVGLVLGKDAGYHPTGVEASKGKPRVGGLVLGKAVGYQPAHELPSPHPVVTFWPRRGNFENQEFNGNSR